MSTKQRTDWANLRRALVMVRTAFHSTKTAHFVTSGTDDRTGFTLRSLTHQDGTRVNDGSEFSALAETLEREYVGDLSRGDVMEEDEHGNAAVDVTIWRPRQRFRIIRGAVANYKVVYYHDQATRDERAQHFADVDAATVTCELWTQSAMLTADPINQGWAADSFSKPST